MELSAIDSYARKPHSADFPVGEYEGVMQHLPVTFDKAAFTGRFIADIYDEVQRKKTEVQAQIKALGKEVDALAEQIKGKAKGQANERASDLDARMVHLRARIEEIDKEVCARGLADKVLLGWGMTQNGEPIPPTFDVLMSRPKEFVIDLFNFCRNESLPKVAEKKTKSLTGASPTTRETLPSTSPETRSTRRRRGRRGSTTPTSSPSPAASESASPNSTAG